MQSVTGTSINISFEDAGEVEAGRMAEELREYIRDEAPDVEVSRKRDDSESMDAGATLAAAILSSAAVVAVARGIQAWLERRTRSTIKIACDDKMIEINYLTCKQATDLSEKLLKLLDIDNPDE